MRSRLAKAWGIFVAVAAALATGGVVVRAPVYASFCLVVVEAAFWCLWIERHPSS
jgi:hypothetical protein